MDTNSRNPSRSSWDWLLLLRAPSIALRGRVLLLAAVAVFGIWCVDALLVGNPESAAKPELNWNELPASAARNLANVWWMAIGPFVELVQGEAIGTNVVRCLWRLAVWGLLGGAIVRVSALSLTRDESPDVAGALKFAWRQKSGFFGGPLLLVAGSAVVLFPLAVVRAAMQLTLLEPMAAVLWPLVIVAAVLATIYLIAAAVGWPMIWAAAAADDSDAFDCVSRMFAYTYQKPLRLAAYTTVAFVVGVVSAVAADLFVAGVLAASSFAAGNLVSPWAASTITWWNSIASSLATVYLTAYLWTSAVGVYLLRRRDVDGVHVDEVFIDPEEIDDGLPELASDANGVPVFDKQGSEAA